ncbi:hypothetical protein KUCAC02_026999, partial [Chaenocephalus aceratus]
MYVCSQCNHPLFSSRSKFAHSSPWPAFTDTIREDSVTKMMESLTAFKVLCGKCGNGLGHEFVNDGPEEGVRTSSKERGVGVSPAAAPGSVNGSLEAILSGSPVHHRVTQHVGYIMPPPLDTERVSSIHLDVPQLPADPTHTSPSYSEMQSIEPPLNKSE